MYSVDHYLKTVQNLQTKWKILTWLRQHDAARPSIGLVYRNKTYQIVYIY